MRRSNSRRGAFTLIEIMVVLALAAIITAITVGGFRAISEGNKRTSCQSNLVQIYQAGRVYARDEGGAFPYYNPVLTSGTQPPKNGIGLWALYTYPEGNSSSLAPVGTKPVERYVRSPKIFHCPSDDYPRGSIGSSSNQLYNDDKTLLNPDYLSYQVNIEGQTYASFRTDSDADPDWKRQLEHYDGSDFVPRPPADNTVVTWCRFHRRLSADGLSTLANGRNFDNVLFYDGTVQLIPYQQNNVDGTSCDPVDASPNGPCVDKWRRIPRPEN